MRFSLDLRSAEGREQLRLEALVACMQTLIAHELPNALVAIQGNARELAALGESGESGRQLLESISTLVLKTDRASRGLAGIVRLLSEPVFGPPVELTEAVREAAADVNSRRPASRVALDVSEPLPAVPLTHALLHAVLTELLANASAAGVAGQPVPVRVEARPEDGGVWLTLRDAGRGMTEAQLARLCQPFTAGRQPGATGPGLGYVLVQQAVAKWGGAVTVESEPERGTTVALLLPVSEGRGR